MCRVPSRPCGPAPMPSGLTSCPAHRASWTRGRPPASPSPSAPWHHPDPGSSASSPMRSPRRCGTSPIAWLATGRVERLLLDTAGGPHPGGTGRRASEVLAAAVAREVPVTLAGGLSPANVADALRTIPAVGVDVASGVEAPRRRAARPRKDPFLVGLFVKRAKAARIDRPQSAPRPTPVHPGLVEVDERGRWGTERQFGGRLAAELERRAGREPGHLRLYLKREDLNHTGAHKITNALGQALLTRRLGKTRVIAETGAGQHGVATATP